MKSKIIILFFAIVLLSHTSCKKFLEQTSKDLIRPIAISHYKELLQGDGYYSGIALASLKVVFMTDDVTLLKMPPHVT